MRRRLATVPLVALLVLAGCGTERPGTERPGAEPAAEVAPVSGGASRVAAIPDGFPLDAGLLTDVDTELKGPGPDAPGLRLDDLCPQLTWPGPADQRDQRLALRVVGPEYAELRELVTYSTEEAATAVVAGLRDALAACTPDEGQVVTAYDAETGTDSVTFGLTYEQGLGGAAYQVLRVGPAVLAVSDAGEFLPESLADYVPDFTRQHRYLTDQMDCHWGAGCAAQPVAVSPGGAGPLAMGASLSDLRAAVPEASVHLAGNGGCSLIAWTSPGGAALRGAVMVDEGLVFLAGRQGATTAEGVAVGDTLGALRAAYPDVQQAENGLWWVERGAGDYSLEVTDDVITEVGVLADDQGCVG